MFGRKQDSSRPYGEVGTLLVERKVPVKVEPKVFFANERTFLAWLHVSVILAGASVAIVAFADNSDPWAQLYGIILLPVAVSFILYSMYMCKCCHSTLVMECSLMDLCISILSCSINNRRETSCHDSSKGSGPV